MKLPTVPDLGLPVLVSNTPPIAPSDGQNATRIVRHGLADVLRWLGEGVGPKPGEMSHAIIGSSGIGEAIFVSPEMFTRLRKETA